MTLFQNRLISLPGLVAISFYSQFGYAASYNSSLTFTGNIGATVSSGSVAAGNGQDLSETNMTNAAVNPATPLPLGGGYSSTGGINLGILTSADSVNPSQTVYGGNGGRGAQGAGGNGGAATSIQNWTDAIAAQTQLQTLAYGGRGGSSYTGTSGNGGNATASSLVNVGGSGRAANALSLGAIAGNGGDNMQSYLRYGSGGNGGNAVSTGASATTSGSNTINVNDTVTGGTGGLGYGLLSHGGDGGTASLLNSYGQSASGSVNVTAWQIGGSGGSGIGGAQGGLGQNSVLNNVVSGSTTGALKLTQKASAGQGGLSDSGISGNGGNATSSLTVSDNTASVFSAVVQATAGAAGDVAGAQIGIPATGTAATAGNATAYLNASSLAAGVGGFANASTADANVSAYAGTGGSTALTPTVGGNALATLIFNTTGITSTGAQTALANGGLGGGYAGTGAVSGANGGTGSANASGSFNSTSTLTSSNAGSSNAANLVTATAVGGSGGSDYYNYLYPNNTGNGGNGGAANVSAYGSSTTGQNIQVFAHLGTGTGANGGNASYGTGGNGASYTANNAASGVTAGNLILNQNVYAGNGGSSLYGTGGNGGNASSNLTYGGSYSPELTTYANNLQGNVQAFAGNGGAVSSNTGSPTGIVGSSGNANANIALISTQSGAMVSASSYANSGEGGNNAFNGTYSNVGTANATAAATGVRGVYNYSVITSAATPGFSNTTSSGDTDKAIANAAVGLSNFAHTNDGFSSDQAFSEAVVVPTNNSNNINSALLTQADIGQTTLGSVTGSFTVVGQGVIGAIANTSSIPETYNMSAEYKLSSAVLGSGSEDLMIGSTYLYGGTRDYGSGGISNLTLTIVDNGTSIINQSFSSYTDFVTFVSTTTNLVHVSGSQDIVVSLSETIAKSDGAGWYYSLALTPDGSTSGTFRHEVAVVATPLLGSFWLMFSAIPLLGFARKNNQRS